MRCAKSSKILKCSKKLENFKSLNSLVWLKKLNLAQKTWKSSKSPKMLREKRLKKLQTIQIPKKFEKVQKAQKNSKTLKNPKKLIILWYYIETSIFNFTENHLQISLLLSRIPQNQKQLSKLLFMRSIHCSTLNSRLFSHRTTKHFRLFAVKTGSILFN